ncbi:MAG: hypothetical protein R3B72_42165 [Polyangiaceae bacterium]
MSGTEALRCFTPDVEQQLALRLGERLPSARVRAALRHERWQTAGSVGVYQRSKVVTE